jgi:SAM-dependent methyltransferase
MFKKIFKKSKDYITTTFDNYKDYVAIQYRSDPKEFLDSRLRIVSSFVYLIPILESLGIQKKTYDEEGKTKGQLKSNDINILDAGCRDGWTIEFLNSLAYPNVIGIELFDEYVDYCNAHGRKAIKGDLHNLEFKDGEFDFVYCRHTLEHCLDPVKVLNEMLRVTRVGGAIYCTFPLEPGVYGKHTTAIPDTGTVDQILSKVDYKFKRIFVDRSAKTKQVLPDGDEMMIFIQRI